MNDIAFIALGNGRLYACDLFLLMCAFDAAAEV